MPVSCLTIALTSIVPVQVKAQTGKQLSLEEAYELARKNYPLIKQKDLVNKSSELTIDNLQTGYFPQIVISGQATYQSEVAELKNPVAPSLIPPLAKDQYKVVADLSQVIYDGGVIREQKNLQQLNTAVEQQRIEVDLYKLKERISQVYLAILFLDEQLKQVDLIKSDLNSGIKRIEAQVNNGTAFRSNLSLLQAELLDADQRAIDIKATREGDLRSLALFINTPLPAGTELIMPASVAVNTNSPIARPELQYYSTQDKLILGQNKMVDAKNLPRASLFLQGGYGRPGLNFLENQFDGYYIGGIRLNWALAGFYTHKKDKQVIELNRQIVETQKETFLLNTRTSLVQQQAEIDKYQQLIATDKEIIELRVKVKDASKAQLENGVITASDYLREVNAEDQARRSYIRHQLQLLQAQINYKNISGN